MPQYDRTVDAALTYTHPKKQRANGRRRPATQQLVLAPAGGAGGDGAGAANCAGGGGAAGTPAGRPAKRPRGGASQRCFNCGSYAHSMRDCWQPYNKELVEQMKRWVLGAETCAFRFFAHSMRDCWQACWWSGWRDVGAGGRRHVF